MGGGKHFCDYRTKALLLRSVTKGVKKVRDVFMGDPLRNFVCTQGKKRIVSLEKMNGMIIVVSSQGLCR